MASGNRVEELESMVKELEATVDGLTDELVECKVRIRELESAVDDAGGLDAVEGMATDDTEADAQSGAESTAETTSADADAAEPVDTPKSEAPDGEDNTESESSDIIIA